MLIQRRAIVLLGVVAGVLCAVPAADAGTLTVDGTTAVYTEDDTDSSNNVVNVGLVGTHHYFREQGDTVGGNGCSDQGGGYWDCGPNITAWRVSLGGAGDVFNATSQLDLPGSTAETMPITLNGGPGNDGMTAGDGDDLIDGGLGSDDVEGGSGNDMFTYAGRSAGVTVDREDTTTGVNGSSEDGNPSQRDRIGPDIEGVIGSSAADELRGGPNSDLLDGGPGDDVLNGLGGADTLRGGTGYDAIQARDLTQDDVDCGADSGVAATDPFDTRANCEPFPPTQTPRRLLFDLAYTFTAGRRGTTLRNLAADVEPGARLTAQCRTKKNKRCTRTRDLARTATSVRLRGFEGKRLPVGAKLSIRVTKEGSIGVVKTLTIRRRKAPSLKTQCLPPGSARPAAC